MSVARSLALGLALTTGVACLPSPDRAVGYGTRPPRAPTSVDDVTVDGYRVRINFEHGKPVRGELLVAQAEGEVVIATKKGHVHRSFADVRRAAVVVDRKAQRWLIGLGTATAVLLPLSIIGGYYALVLIPLVSAGGSMSMGIAWAESRVVLRGTKLSYLYQYARWPQGWPQPSEPPSTSSPIDGEVEVEVEPAPEPLPITPQPLPR